MNKARPTAADYMIIALSPALIMVLVGSLCFFLIEVFYRGKMAGSIFWVMFWFIIAIVLVSRIAIESSPQHAVAYGLGLAGATWLFMVRTQPAYLVGIVLLAVVWFCAHKLVWDCTLIDEDADSSGQGLLQKSPAATQAPPTKNPKKKTVKKIIPPQNPGRWVIYFSVFALPLFGIGQMLLPSTDTASRRAGFVFLMMYLGAALGLLVTTSFLGLRRYLRQRYLKMPASIAVAWLKFGVGVAVLVLIGAIFLPRPGAREAWAALSYQINYQIQKASKYASAANAPGEGEGKAGQESGGKQGSAPKSDGEKAKSPGGQPKPGESPSQPQAPQPSSLPSAPPQVYNFLRWGLIALAALVVGSWLFRNRAMLGEMLRSVVEAIRQFLRNFLALNPYRKAAVTGEAGTPKPKFSTFAQYKNPFFATGENTWPAEKVLIYSYEALQVWAREQKYEPHPQETAREFCERLGGVYPKLEAQLPALARLYSCAAFGRKFPDDADLEPIKELWRHLPTAANPTM